MPNKLLVLSDLDRTLFDTERFFADIWDFSALHYGFDGDMERKRAPDFFNHHGQWYDYRFFDHLADCVGESFDHHEFIKAACAQLTNGYLYDDVTAETIGLIDAIITFGNVEYQTLKLALCPQLNGIERHIILGSKGEYIRQTFKQPSVLIDDKDLEAEIQPPATFVRIDRTIPAGGSVQSPGLVMHSFTELPELLERIKH